MKRVITFYKQTRLQLVVRYHFSINNSTHTSNTKPIIIYNFQDVVLALIILSSKLGRSKTTYLFVT